MSAGGRIALQMSGAFPSLDVLRFSRVNMITMKVGSKGYYGLLALADLAQNSRGRNLAQVKEIARRQRIPEEYLGQIMVLLKRANLVHGARGPGGGYRLARPAENISVAQVLKVLEGPLMGIDVKDTRDRVPVSPPARRLIEAWTQAVATAEKILEDLSVADLCRPEDAAQMYYI
jgi:Rrf2 family protein